MDWHWHHGPVDVRSSLAAGSPVTVFSRTRAKADPRRRGCRMGRLPGLPSPASDIVFTMVACRRTFARCNGRDGIMSALKPGAIAVDMTTTEPSLAIEIASAAGQRCTRGGRAGVRRRCRRQERDVVDHGRRRCRRGHDRAAAIRALGKNIVHQGAGRRPFEDVHPDRHRRDDDWRLRALSMARRPLNLETMLSSIKSGAAGC